MKALISEETFLSLEKDNPSVPKTMRFRFLLSTLILSAALLAASSCAPRIDVTRVVTNPIDLDYAFTHNQGEQFNGMREAADPVVALYKDRYYLFPSKSFGYWSSEDMQHWRFITNDILPFDNYAPTVMVYKGDLYWMVSGCNTLYRTSTPEDGASWTVACDTVTPFADEPGRTVHDPYLFADEDGRIYLYWGCSTVDPIMGVELDPDNGFRAMGQPVALILHREAEYGWECRGDLNETADPSSNEGAAMLKYKGRYYLQYAGPGTEFDSYGDGLYIGEAPLGPFTHCEDSPFSVKPGGWMTGAGHGDTFQDRYGNWWHTASTVICQRFLFERRIGFYPAFFTPDGTLHTRTEFSDYPYVLPDRKVDWSKTAPWTGWMNLTLRKSVTASSELPEHPASAACDNSVKTWWSAGSGNAGEWLCVDLGAKKTVRAVQTNFADEGFGIGPGAKTPYHYILECSKDGVAWQSLKDRREAGTEHPHELVVLPKAVKARYVRIRNTAPLTGCFSIFDLRVFGKGVASLPAPVKELSAERGADPRRIKVRWTPVDGADGYILRWGVRKDALYSSCESAGPEIELGLFSVGQEYWFSVDAFNESGVRAGKNRIRVLE